MREIKLTQFSHGGGCGCKIAPSVLRELLQDIPLPVSPHLLVGAESSDDAAVYQLNEHQAIVATTDFFMPIVDDPFDFGRIAAANAISDIYAMGAQPILALAIVGMPIGKLPVDVIKDILKGGESVCATAGIAIAGGHSIDAPEPIYGLVALGVIHPAQVRRNDQARPGDTLILGKGLGVGILSAALQKGKLPAAGYQRMVASTTQLNTPGQALAAMVGVRAMTDVTGFGLLGHLLEVCRGSRVGAEVAFERLPLFPEAVELVKQGIAPGAAERNWDSYGHEVALPADMARWQRDLLCDPQTSGGLLVACAPEAVDDVLRCFHDEGFLFAQAIGRVQADAVRVVVR